MHSARWNSTVPRVCYNSNMSFRTTGIEGISFAQGPSLGIQSGIIPSPHFVCGYKFCPVFGQLLDIRVHHAEHLQPGILTMRQCQSPPVHCYWSMKSLSAALGYANWTSGTLLSLSTSTTLWRVEKVEVRPSCIQLSLCQLNLLGNVRFWN